MRGRRPYGLIAACLAFLAASIGALMAHEGGEEGMEAPGLMSDRYVEMLDARVRLSDKQREKVSAIVKDASPSLRKKFDQIQSLRAQLRSLDRDLQTAMRDASERVRAELNADQKDAFDEFRMQMRRGPGRGPWGQSGPGMMRPERGGPGMPEDMMPPEMWGHPHGRRAGKDGPPPGPKDKKEKEEREDDD